MIKNNISLLVLIVCLLFHSNNFAVLKHVKVKGSVFSKSNNKPLADTNISIKNLEIGTISNSKGEFLIELSPCTYTFVFAYVGYKTIEKVITVSLIEEQRDIQIYLEQNVISGQEVAITATADDPAITLYKIPQRKLLTIANPLPDALLSLKTLPGVFSGNDQSTFYSVRGGNYDENLIYLDGIEIFQPLLVRKGIAENPSIVNPYLVENINLRTGAFPPRYGDKLSSVLDISYKEGDTQGFSGMAALSTIKSEIILSGHVNSNLTYILAARRINYGYLFNALQTEGSYVPDFKDIQFNITWKPTARNTTKLLGIFADSKFRLSPQTWKNTWFLADTDIWDMDVDGYESFEHETRVIGMQTIQKLTNKLEVTFGISYFNQKEFEDTDIKFEHFEMESKQEVIHNKLDNLTYRLYTSIKYDISEKHHFNIGGELKEYKFADKLNERVFFYPDTESNSFVRVNDSKKLNSFGYSGYCEYYWQPSPLFTLQTGIRFSRFNFNNELLILPRLIAIYNITDRTGIMASVGKYAQPPLYKEFRGLDGRSPTSLKAQKSTLYTLGFEHFFKNFLSFRTNAYYKDLKDLISYELWDVRTIYSGRNDAIGYVYGVDAHFKGNFIDDCIAWLSYNYMMARENLDNDLEKWVPRPTDQRHTFAATLQDKMYEFPNSRIHIRVLFGSGFHYTYHFFIEDEERNVTEILGKRNRWSLPWYRRFDVGFTQEFTFFDSYKVTFREEILNLFNRYNVLGYSWMNGKKIEHGLSERTFNIGAVVEF